MPERGRVLTREQVEEHLRLGCHRCEALARSHELLREALDDAASWLEDIPAVLREVREDAERGFHPEKGWPPHIEAAKNMEGDVAQMAQDARAVLSGVRLGDGDHHEGEAERP